MCVVFVVQDTETSVRIFIRAVRSVYGSCVCAVQLIQNQLYRAYFIVLTVSCGYANNMITHPKNAILASQ